MIDTPGNDNVLLKLYGAHIVHIYNGIQNQVFNKNIAESAGFFA